MDQSQKADIESMIESIADEKLRAHVTKGLKYMDDPSRRLIVANGVARAREAGYHELALKLAQLAYDKNSRDPFFLLELCSTMGQADKVVQEINNYCQRVELESLPRDQREKVIIALAAAYKDIGNTSESIRILEELKSEMARPAELLAEQYYQIGQPQKAIDLLYERIKYVGKLNSNMAIWLAKSFEATGDYAQAMDMLAGFQDDPSVKPIYDRARAELGLPVESATGRPSSENPQPGDKQPAGGLDVSCG